MTPTIGRIVLYKLHASDVDQVNRRREDFHAFNRANPAHMATPGSFPGRSGHVGHFGNEVAEGEAYPAIVVRAFGGTTVNLHVLLDGNDTYWATSRPEGDAPGQWSWAPRAEHQPGDRPQTF